MKLTRSQLKTQYERAKRWGWIPHFVEAAKKTRGFFDVADLMGIGSRETNLDPKWLTKPGDHGNGFGLMQADKRSFPHFTKSEAWKDARQGILFGAEVLMQKYHDTVSGIGLKRSVKSSKTGKLSSFVGKHVSGLELQRVVIAAYNAGRWPHYAVSNGKDPDTYTTGKDYSSDVMERAAALRAWLKQDGYISSAAIPTSHSKPAPNPIKEGEVDKPPIDSATESKVTQEKGDTTVEISAKNEQDVTEPAVVKSPEPYMNIGFWAVIKRDLAAATGGNLSLSGLAEYAQQASGWPEWVVALLGKLAIGVLIATLFYFIFRIIHYLADSWKKHQKTKHEVDAATSTVRKDITWR